MREIKTAIQSGFLTTAEAGAMLSPPVSAQTIINWVKAGNLNAVRIGRGPRRIPVASMVALLNANGAEVPEILK